MVQRNEVTDKDLTMKAASQRDNWWKKKKL